MAIFKDDKCAISNNMICYLNEKTAGKRNITASSGEVRDEQMATD